MPEMVAIKSATMETAKLLRIEKDLGSLEVGKIADIIAVKGNPLNDISVMENVMFVMKEEKFIKIENNSSCLKSFVSQDKINLDKSTPIFMCEDKGLCTYIKHHKSKIALFFGNAEYRDELISEGYEVIYKDFNDDLQAPSQTSYVML